MRDRQQEPIVRDPAAIRRIAIFHLNGVGDLLFSLPALQAIRQHFPHAHITSIIRPHLGALLAPTQLADEIISRPNRGRLVGAAKFLRKLRTSRFDLAVLMSQSASANVYAFLSGISTRVGFIDTIFPRLLSHPINLRGISSTAKLLHLAERLGACPQQREYVGMLVLTEEQQNGAKRLLREAGLADQPFAVLSFGQGPGARADYKAWSHDSFAAVGKSLLQKNLVPVVVGTRAEVAEAELLAEKIGAGAVCLAGRTSLGELAAVIQQTALLIGIDSGPVHLAAALRVPVVGLYGPTDPEVTGPEGAGAIVIRKARPCAPCRKPTCEDRPCMSAITPEEVIRAAEKLIGEKVRGRRENQLS